MPVTTTDRLPVPGAVHNLPVSRTTPRTAAAGETQNNPTIQPFAEDRFIPVVQTARSSAPAGKPDFAKMPPVLTGDAGLKESVSGLSSPTWNIAATSDGRIFTTFHKTQRGEPKLAELVTENGRTVAKPFPSERFQKQLDMPFSIHVDEHIDANGNTRRILWTIDIVTFKGRPRIMAFDLDNPSDEPIYQHRFSKKIAGVGQVLNDFSLFGPRDENGIPRYVAMTDTRSAALLRWRPNIFGWEPFGRSKKPALVVLDTHNGKAHRALEGHPSTSDDRHDVYVDGKRIRPFGFLPIRRGANSIAVSPDGKTLYFSALGTGKLYSMPTEVLTQDLSEEEYAEHVRLEALTPKSDGLGVDAEGNIYITAVELHSVFRYSPKTKKIEKLVQDDRLGWPDSVTWTRGPNGETRMLVNDSALDKILPEAHFSDDDRARVQEFFRIFSVDLPGHEGQN